MKKPVLKLAPLILLILIFAQTEHSGQNLELSIASENPFVNSKVLMNSDDEIAFVDYNSFRESTSIDLYTLQQNANLANGLRVKKDGHLFKELTNTDEYYFNGLKLVSVQMEDLEKEEQTQFMLWWNPDLNRFKAFEFDELNFINGTQSDAGLIIMNYSELPSLRSFTQDGTELWSKAYTSLLPFNRPGDVSINDQGDIAFSVNQLEENIEKGMVVLTDNNGNVERAVTIDGINILNIHIDENKELIISGITKKFSHLNGVRSDAFIMRLNAQLEVLWAKIFYIDNFFYFDLQMSVDNEGNTSLFYYSSSEDFPVSFTRVDEAGFLFDQTGFLLFEPTIQLTTEGSLMISSLDKDDVASLGNAPRIIYKTSVENDLGTCFQIESCMVDEFIGVNSQEAEFRASNTTPLSESNFETSTISTSFNDYSCIEITGLPPVEFDFTDSLCLFDCGIPANVFDEFPVSRFWELEKPDGSSEFIENVTFPEFCFDQAGDHILKHGIYGTFCPQTSEKRIHVRSAEKSEDLFICPGETIWVLDRMISEPGSFDTIVPNNDPMTCDSFLTFNIQAAEFVETFEIIEICEGESADVFGTQITEEGGYSNSYFTAQHPCDSIHNITLIVNPNPEPLVEVQASCIGQGQGWININPGDPSRQYTINWEDDLNATFFIDDLDVGDYAFTLTDNKACVYTDELRIEEIPPPLITVVNDIEFELGSSASIYTDAPSTDMLEYNWSPGIGLSCVDCSDPIVDVFNDQDYELTVTNEAGCFSLYKVNVKVEKNYRVYIPTAFSPNRDGVNDELVIHANATVDKIRSFDVFDRWGNHIYSEQNMTANDSSISWDGTYRGKELEPGLFVYFTEIEYIDGEVEKKKGEVMLVK